MFIGFVYKYKSLYKKLENNGYVLVFKETVTIENRKIKGNCDGELILKACEDFYENNLRDFIFITGDGDFKCLIEFLIKNSCEMLILSPNKKKCSILLKRTKAKITDLEDHYSKFSK